MAINGPHRLLGELVVLIFEPLPFLRPRLGGQDISGSRTYVLRKKQKHNKCPSQKKKNITR